MPVRKRPTVATVAKAESAPSSCIPRRKYQLHLGM
jgi:hypothetical protein